MRMKIIIIFFIRLGQNCPKWIKLDQIGILPDQDVDIKSCHNHHEDKNGHFIFNQIGSDLSKMAQT